MGSISKPKVSMLPNLNISENPQPPNLPIIQLPASVPEQVPLPPPKVKLTKAQKKEIKKQKAIDDKCEYLRNQLERELKYAKKSVERGQVEWQEICQKIKVEGLNNELDEWRQEIQRILDRKDYRIKLLIENLNIAEEQYERNYSKHCRLLDYLINFCNHMVKTNKVLYESTAYEMIHQFRYECDDNDYNNNHTTLYYEHLIHSQNAVAYHTFRKTELKQLENYEDVYNSNILQQHLLRNQTLKKMQVLRNQLESVFYELEHQNLNTRPKHEYDHLMERQKFHEKEFLRQGRIADSGFQSIWELQANLTQLETNSHFNINDMQNERNYFVEVYWQLKNKVKLNNQKTEFELQELGSATYDVIRKFKKFEKFGELLLSLVTCCRKLQTQREKITPFAELLPPSSLLPASSCETSEEDTTDIGMSQYQEDLWSQMEAMSNFNHRSAVAETHVILLRRELQQLQKQNNEYIAKIRACYEIATQEKIMRSIKSSQYIYDASQDLLHWLN